MGSALVYVVVVALVAGAVFLLVSLVFGRGEELAPMPPTATPTRLPARDLTGADVRELRFQQAARGYKCSEVDWALERLGAEVDALQARLEVLTASAPGRETAAPAVPAVPSDAPAEGDVREVAVDPTPTDPTVAGRAGESSGSLGGRSGADAGHHARWS